MANLKKYVGFYCPDKYKHGSIQWTDIYEGQVDINSDTSDLKLEMFEIKAESAPEARRKLFSMLYPYWNEDDYSMRAVIQILINVMNMDDPDNFENEYIEIFGDVDSDKLITIVNENYDTFELDDSWDYFSDMTESSKNLFKELSEKTKMELYYDALNSDLMIYPLNRS
ncbi:MAG TPA: hypothetical protein VIK86_01600 [Candidatus Paceibacterota bacterium]